MNRSYTITNSLIIGSNKNYFKGKCIHSTLQNQSISIDVSFKANIRNIHGSCTYNEVFMM